MKETEITYPQYRKYSNNKSFYKINSSLEFEEIQVLGKKISHNIFSAQILPDRNYIYDLTFNYSQHWIVSSKDEFESLKNQITNHN